MDLELVKWGVPVLISLGGAVLALLSFIRAGRADRRSEQTERLDRVQFELSRAVAQPGLFRLFNVGKDALTGVEIHASSIVGVSLDGPRKAAELNPTEYMPFTLRTPQNVRVPVSLRVTWSGPFEGEQWVLVPEDPAAPWAGVIWSSPLPSS